MQYTSAHPAPETIEIASPEAIAQARADAIERLAQKRAARAKRDAASQLDRMRKLLERAYRIIETETHPGIYDRWLADAKPLLDEIGD
jgi:hypothetical protein